MPTPFRHFSFLDKCCMHFDEALRTIIGIEQTSQREYPSEKLTEGNLTDSQTQHAAGLMRVNHTGEVCAQALYQAQALTSKNPSTREQMQKAAEEETDHLAWCQTRLMELGSHTSYLNPLWYAGSFAIGLTAGLISDRWSLGFVAETETQVVKHLEKHLHLLPENDTRSFAILSQMKKDEAQHRDQAIQAGATPLPFFVKQLMRFSSKIMVKTAYYV